MERGWKEEGKGIWDVVFMEDSLRVGLALNNNKG